MSSYKSHLDEEHPDGFLAFTSSDILDLMMGKIKMENQLQSTNVYGNLNSRNRYSDVLQKRIYQPVGNYSCSSEVRAYNPMKQKMNIV